MDETGHAAFGFANHLDAIEAFQYFLPQHAQLQFRQAVAHAAVDAETEGEVLADIGTIDDELVRALEHALIAIAGDVPHHDLVAPSDLAAGEFDVAISRFGVMFFTDPVRAFANLRSATASDGRLAGSRSVAEADGEAPVGGGAPVR